MLLSRFQELAVEEISNTITHGFGLILSVIGFVVLIIMAASRGGVLLVSSCVIYGTSLMVLYAASTAYHSTTSASLKRKLQVLDHCCIYLLIAGSYTPFGLVILGKSYGYGLLVLIWAFAILGIASKFLLRHRFPAISVISFLVMGWLGAFAIQPLLAALGFVPIVLTIAGGLAYSFGVIFFAWNRIPHNHAIFHVFVLAGSILHYLAVVVYVVPAV